MSQKATMLINPTLIRKVEDNDLEACEGKAESPSDWVQKCGPSIPLPYEDTEAYKKFGNRQNSRITRYINNLYTVNRGIAI